MLTDVTVQPRGSSALAAQTIGDTTVTVEDTTDFAAVVDSTDADDANVGTLDICGVQYDYTAVDPSTGVITLATALTAAVDESDPVLVVVGGEVAQDWTAVVDPGEGDTIPVPLPYALRALLPEGHYDPPLPVKVADDLSTILEVPGRQPVLSEKAVPPTVTDAINAAQTAANGKNVITYSEDGPGDAANTEGDTWFVFTDDGSGNKLVTEQWHGDGGTDWTQVKVDSLLIASINAAVITTGTLSGIEIEGVTITGSTLQTAPSDTAPRIVIGLTGDSNRIIFYDTDWTLNPGSIATFSNKLLIASGTDTEDLSATHGPSTISLDYNPRAIKLGASQVSISNNFNDDPDDALLYVNGSVQIIKDLVADSCEIKTITIPGATVVPAAPAGEIVSEDTDGTDPLTIIKGNGDYRFAGTNLDDVAWTTMTSSLTTARWCVRNGIVFVQVDGSISMASGTVTTLVTAANGIPSDYRPSVQAQVGGSFSGRNGIVLVTTAGEVKAVQINGTTTSSVAGMVTYPVGT